MKVFAVKEDMLDGDDRLTALCKTYEIAERTIEEELQDRPEASDEDFHIEELDLIEE